MKRGLQPVSLSLPPGREGWLALANAAQALLSVARAALGENALSPVAPSLSFTPSTSATVAEAVNDFIVAKARSGRSDRYIRALKNSLGKFSKGRTRKMLGAVTLEEIEIWLHGNGWAARTQKGYLGDVQTLYNFSVRRGYCPANTANGIEVSQVHEKPVGIHTPAEVAAILALARHHDLNIMRSLAIRYFAGLRASEAESLCEGDIKTEMGVIEVTAAKSKTRRRRLVTIHPVLNAWLGVGGSLPLKMVSKRTRAFLALVRKAGLPWPANAPRHSFCSYHLAQWENAGKTALEAGHSEQMLFHHYRALVTKAQAAEYWSIYPISPQPTPNQNAL